LTDKERPRRLGPKKVSRIRQAFALRKKDDVRTYVVKRGIEKGDKTFYKRPKIQRLVTEKRMRRKIVNNKRLKENWKKASDLKMQYEKLLSKYLKEKKAAAKKEAAAAATATKKK
jgi:small subunit ribosomal protein S6e